MLLRALEEPTTAREPGGCAELSRLPLQRDAESAAELECLLQNRLAAAHPSIPAELREQVVHLLTLILGVGTHPWVEEARDCGVWFGTNRVPRSLRTVILAHARRTDAAPAPKTQHPLTTCPPRSQLGRLEEQASHVEALQARLEELELTSEEYETDETAADLHAQWAALQDSLTDEESAAHRLGAAIGLDIKTLAAALEEPAETAETAAAAEDRPQSAPQQASQVSRPGTASSRYRLLGELPELAASPEKRKAAAKKRRKQQKQRASEFDAEVEVEEALAAVREAALDALARQELGAGGEADLFDVAERDAGAAAAGPA